MNILIAPHVDDGIIGAYTLIKKGLIDCIIYIDPTPKRYELAVAAGVELGFSVEAMNFDKLLDFLQKRAKLQIMFLVPDIADNHVLHKAVNCIGRLSGCHLGYYTTEMNTGYTKELSKEQQEEKRAALNKYYPDQSSLWKRDWKYFLFEGIVLDWEK